MPSEAIHKAAEIGSRVRNFSAESAVTDGARTVCVMSDLAVHIFALWRGSRRSGFGCRCRACSRLGLSSAARRCGAGRTGYAWGARH